MVAMREPRLGAHGVIKCHTVARTIETYILRDTDLSAGPEQCTGRVRSEPMKGEENRDNIDKMAYWWPTDDP